MKRLAAFALLFCVSRVVHAEDLVAPVDALVIAPAAVEKTPVVAPPAPVTQALVKPVPHEPNKDAPVAKGVKPEPVSAVAPLQGLVGFHEKEIDSAKKMIERWNEKLGTTLKRRQDMQKDIATMKAKIDELQKEGTKKSKNEASRLTKQIGRVNKDIKGIDGQLKAQSKQLANELKEVSKESQTALKDAYQQAVTEVLAPR